MCWLVMISVGLLSNGHTEEQPSMVWEKAAQQTEEKLMCDVRGVYV